MYCFDACEIDKILYCFDADDIDKILFVSAGEIDEKCRYNFNEN
jgi:hypothetical protein